jgi:hypothetical protein
LALPFAPFAAALPAGRADLFDFFEDVFFMVFEAVLEDRLKWAPFLLAWRFFMGTLGIPHYNVIWCVSQRARRPAAAS